MFCVNCGKQIVDTARFCNYCGTKVVDFDENIQQVTAESSENPIPVSAEDVNSSENVENSVDLLKMQNDASSAEPQMNDLSENSDTPFSEKETDETPSPDIQSGAVGAQHSADAAPAPETSDMQLDVNIPISQPSELSAPISQPSGQPEPITQPSEQPAAIAKTAEQPERRYTIGHIIMCLASTALMAIVAGIFAGLYFSVV